MIEWTGGKGQPSHDNCNTHVIPMDRNVHHPEESALSLEDQKLLESAEGYYMLGQLPEVLVELENVSPHGRRDRRYLLRTASALWGLGKFNEALVHIETLLRNYPLHEGARGMKAMLFTHTGRHREAYETLQEAVALFPHNSAHRYDLGRAAAKLGMWDEARRWIQSAISIRGLMKTFALANEELAPIHADIKAMPLMN